MNLKKALGDSAGLRRRLLFVAWLGERLEREFGTRAVVVGGTAAEYYSGAALATFDVDVIYANGKHIDSVLSGEGFSKQGRYWMNDELDVTLEAPDHTLDGDEDRVISVQASEDASAGVVHMIGLEDLIVDRLEQFAFAGARECLEQASFLMRSDYSADIDKAYLSKRIDEISGLKAKLKPAPIDVLAQIGKLGK